MEDCFLKELVSDHGVQPCSCESSTLKLNKKILHQFMKKGLDCEQKWET
jgi:hypothetical protein